MFTFCQDENMLLSPLQTHYFYLTYVIHLQSQLPENEVVQSANVSCVRRLPIDACLGVLITHENIVAAMAGQQERVFSMIDVENDIYIAYLPLAHILELCCGKIRTTMKEFCIDGIDAFLELLIYYMGVKIGYSSPQTLTDQSTAIKRGQKGDLQVLRPHIMSCVPVCRALLRHRCMFLFAR
jgi:hypothetical protein